MSEGITQNISTGMVTGVSLGPGDPDLITVKGLKILKQANKIYFPGTLSDDGKKESYALSILKNYNLSPKNLHGFYLRMNLDRKQAKERYRQTAQQIKKDYQIGLKVAVASEGDAGTYSSFSYLLAHLVNDGIPVFTVPGITSYAAVASSHSESLCIQNEKMVVLPHINNEEELESCINRFNTVILMKISSAIHIIISILDKLSPTFFYGEHMGTSRQFTSTALEDIRHREIPYFALLIIKNKKPAA